MFRMVLQNRRRVVMSPNRYTELFFLDEAVAFAAPPQARRGDKIKRDVVVKRLTFFRCDPH